jgi:hypothetical protein
MAVYQVEIELSMDPDEQVKMQPFWGLDLKRFVDSYLFHESIIAKQVPVERTTAGSQFCKLEVAKNVTGNFAHYA